MNQDAKPAPFNVGYHVRYISSQQRTLPTGEGKEKELVLTAGMEGVILLSTGEFSDRGTAAPSPWRCQVQFTNGFTFEIDPANEADFELVRGARASNEWWN